MRSSHPAEGMYGPLRHLVKPILEKISVATRTGTASLKPTNSSLVPTSLKTWYPRSLLLTATCWLVSTKSKTTLRQRGRRRRRESRRAWSSLRSGSHQVVSAPSGVFPTACLGEGGLGNDEEGKVCQQQTRGAGADSLGRSNKPT